MSEFANNNDNNEEIVNYVLEELENVIPEPEEEAPSAIEAPASDNEFDAFCASFDGDKSNNEKMLDAFLAEREELSDEIIPEHIRDEVGKKYNELNYCVSALEISSVDELASPLSVLGSKKAEIKKIVLFNNTPETVFTAAFERVISAIDLNDDAFLKIYSGISAFFKREKKTAPKYAVIFESAVESLYRALLSEKGRLSVCVSLRNKAFRAINSYFESDAPKNIIPDGASEQIKAQLEQTCNVWLEEAAAYKYDLRAALNSAVDTALERHNQKYKEIEENSRMGAAEFAKLDALSKSLAGKNSAELDDRMSEILTVYTNYPNIVNFYAAKYAVRKRSTIGSGSDPIFVELAKSMGRIRSIASLVFEESPEVALSLTAAYAPLNEAAVTMISMVRSNSAVFNNIDPRVADAACRGAIKKLHSRMEKEGLSEEAEQDIYSALEGFPKRKNNEAVEFVLAGNTKIFYSVMCDAWKAYRNEKPFNPKKKSKKGLVWTLVVLLLVAAAAVGVYFMHKHGILDFGGDSSDTSSAVSEDNSAEDASDNSDISDASDISDTSDVSDSTDVSDTSDPSDTSDNSDVSEPEIPIEPEIADSVTVNGIGIPGDSSVSLLKSSYSGATWKRVIVLTPDAVHASVYAVSQIKDGVSEVTLAEGQIALAFSLADDDNKASIEAMLAYTDSFTTSTLLKADGKTYKIYKAPLVTETSIKIDCFNEKIQSNKAILYCGDSVTAFLDNQTVYGYVALFEATSIENEYKIIDAKVNANDFANVDVSKMIIVIVHYNNNDAAEARYDQAEEQWQVGATVQLVGLDVANQKRVPDKNASIYMTLLDEIEE